MNEIGNYLLELLVKTGKEVVLSFQHNWKILLISIVIAVGLATYMNSDKMTKFLFRRKNVSIIASVLFGSFTPLCACGTTAVLIGMLTTTLPWGPIMAFLTSSPLMSPDGFVFISGVIGLRFAIALTVASLVIGVGSGLITNLIEKKTKYLEGQSRFLQTQASTAATCGCGTKTVTTDCSCQPAVAVPACSCTSSKDAAEEGSSTISIEGDGQLCCDQTTDSNLQYKNFVKKLKLRELATNFLKLGIKQILLFYAIFIAIGSLINTFIPTSIIEVLFGNSSFYAVPLASLIGLPLYITTNSGIPIIQSLIQSGASEGAMLAFIITGSATSAWVIAGLATFMKKRAIALYVGFVLVGGMLSGYALDLIKLFF